MTSRFDRRSFIQASSAVGVGALLPRAEDPGRCLVVIQLAGGNDGLDTIIPLQNDAYHRARPELRVSSASELLLEDDLAFHPLLTRLHFHWSEGRIAAIQGVGYPQPNRSHFESFDVWHAGDPRGRALDEGWIGRLIAARFGDRNDPIRLVHLGGEPPYSLHSTRHPPAAMASPIQYRWVAGGADVSSVVEATGKREGSRARSRLLERLRGQVRAARDSSRRLRAAASRPRRFPYPTTDFGHALRDAAALLDSEVQPRVLSVELSGFDTHGDQLRQRARLLTQLDEGLGVFLDDLGTFAAGRRSLVLVFSEFGRRVAENASGGTDHGAAGPAFVLGHEVRGGLYGSHPSLTELDDGDLVFTTDFRRIYAELGWAALGVPSREFLFGDYPRIDCVG